jgi:curved DNA-binding protein CbpA
MQKNSFEILNVSPNATDEEILNSYNTLKQKYSEERFLEGEAGNYAAKMLTEIDVAFNDIMNFRRESNSTDNSSEAFKEVEEALKKGDINSAQQKLDGFNERTAEWHYLQSVVFYKKNWMNESKKQLELAIRIDASNQKYKQAYEKLEAQINFNNQTFNSGNTTNAGGSYDGQQKQMGGDSCNDAANCCSTMVCINCLYNCCCGCH